MKIRTLFLISIVAVVGVGCDKKDAKTDTQSRSMSVVGVPVYDHDFKLGDRQLSARENIDINQQ